MKDEAKRVEEAISGITNITILAGINEQERDRFFNSLKELENIARSYLSVLKDPMVLNLGISTGIDGNLTYGYGKLDDLGYFEFELDEHQYNAVKQMQDKMLLLLLAKDREIAELKHKTTCLNEALEQAHSYWKSTEAKLQALSARCQDVEGITRVIKDNLLLAYPKHYGMVATAISAWLQKGEGESECKHRNTTIY